MGSRAVLVLVLVSAALIGLAGAKINSVIERGGAEGFWWELENGYRYPGAIVALFIGLPILFQLRGIGISLLDFADIVAPAAGTAMAVVRVGCFMAGCCHGPISTLPWAVAFPPGSPAWDLQLRSGLLFPIATATAPVHPLQLYFGVWSLAVGLFLFRTAPWRAYKGQVLLGYLALDNLAKALLELLREPPVPHLRWLSLGIGLATLAVLVGRWLGGTPSTATSAAGQPG